MNSEAQPLNIVFSHCFIDEILAARVVEFLEDYAGRYRVSISHTLINPLNPAFPRKPDEDKYAKSYVTEQLSEYLKDTSSLVIVSRPVLQWLIKSSFDTYSHPRLVMIYDDFDEQKPQVDIGGQIIAVLSRIYKAA